MAQTFDHNSRMRNTINFDQGFDDYKQAKQKRIYDKKKTLAEKVCFSSTKKQFDKIV